MWDVQRPDWPACMRPNQIPASRPETLAAREAGLPEPERAAFWLWLVQHHRVRRDGMAYRELVGAGR